mmetsp:Transcript_25854/g.61676  ORF Transcript_25854/g.61676 Transcript_25854/m.61676 type:complete len:225 (+) Transcript_25854:400-1074(+)
MRPSASGPSPAFAQLSPSRPRAISTSAAARQPSRIARRTSSLEMALPERPRSRWKVCCAASSPTCRSRTAPFSSEKSSAKMRILRMRRLRKRRRRTTQARKRGRRGARSDCFTPTRLATSMALASATSWWKRSWRVACTHRPWTMGRPAQSMLWRRAITKSPSSSLWMGKSSNAGAWTRAKVWSEKSQCTSSTAFAARRQEYLSLQGPKSRWMAIPWKALSKPS